jgi:acetoin utilization protein AcuC
VILPDLYRDDMPANSGPLLVFGPRSTTYDFGSLHPLTPRRFGPGIDLLQEVGARPGLAPEPASDDDLLLSHTPRYLAIVRRFSSQPDAPAEAGIGPGDDPAFSGMHEAAASVADGSLRAVEAILRGEVEHAFHPGGGLHHALPERASGFCIYNDPALAIARARAAGLRVLYVDLDTHHGDGVQAIHADDPGVLTFSIHESGRYLFPGTGFANELGRGEAAGTSVNVPLEPYTGEGPWLHAVERIVPALAAAFGPDIVVSQHGADSHAFDPLAHLRVTTTAMGAAAILVDHVAHRYAAGRWLSTGGGGYDVYRVVPRAWALTWLAGAHRDAPDELPRPWRDRWAAEAGHFAQAPVPERFGDEPNAGVERGQAQRSAEDESLARALVIRQVVVPRLLWLAEDRGWWTPLATVSASAPGSRTPESMEEPTIVRLDADGLARIGLAPRTIPPFDAAEGLLLLRRAVEAGAWLVGAVAGETVVGVALADVGPAREPEAMLCALGVAPAYRRRGLGTRLLDELLRLVPDPITAMVSVAERDPAEPLPGDLRRAIATRMLERAGFSVRRASGSLGEIDPAAIEARHSV